ncbi:hypothetical protein [Roseateles cavernae]|uniref:hypothetical protein n=1 Tax=Roseateles cavernae TaxID=3153578 RepID=UPI0032E3D07A
MDSQKPPDSVVMSGENNTNAYTAEGDILIGQSPPPPEETAQPCTKCGHPNWPGWQICRVCRFDRLAWLKITLQCATLALGLGAILLLTLIHAKL